ncbi:transmembrane protein 165 [Glossina fuscipes]|uniref:Transmembrane protein 165 n=1 Tax=Glossina fuscipes TaxID=7396 RepID=A0A9C5ZGG7_9MUSC|nr:transmembrane protein 165 [Glossina fuscipes]
MPLSQWFGRTSKSLKAHRRHSAKLYTILYAVLSCIFLIIPAGFTAEVESNINLNSQASVRPPTKASMNIKVEPRNENENFVLPDHLLENDESKEQKGKTGFIDAFTASVCVILFTELGDKTFFIAAIMAMRHPRLIIFAGAISALALMTILSVVFGMAATIIPKIYTYYISTALFAIFGLKMIYEGYFMKNTDTQDELEEVQSDLRKREDELFRRARQREEISKRKNSNKSYKKKTEVTELSVYPSYVTATCCQHYQQRDLLTTSSNISELKMNNDTANNQGKSIESAFTLNVITGDHHYNNHHCHLQKATFYSSPTLSTPDDQASVYEDQKSRSKQQKLYASSDNNHKFVTLVHLTRAGAGNPYRTNGKMAISISSISSMAINSAATACTCQDDLKETGGGGSNERVRNKQRKLIIINSKKNLCRFTNCTYNSSYSLERDVTAVLVQDPESGVVRKNVKKGAAYLTTRVLVQAFTMTFLAEWGDRSQLATIILAASKDVYGVITGGVVGHSICTGLAVVGGRMVAAKISLRTVTIVGGVVFLGFALYALIARPDDI